MTTAIDHQPVTGYILGILVFMSLGSFSYGYASAIIATTLGQPSFNEYFELATRSNAAGLIGAMNGLYFAGGFFGVLSFPVVADRWGRKWGVALGACLVLVSGAFLAGSVHIAEFIVFRFVSGAGAFILVVAVPTWMAEVAPPKFRGAIVEMHAIGYILGYVLQGWIGLGFYFWTEPVTWRVPLALQCVGPTVLLCGLYWMPESPRFLMMKSRADEAEAILTRLHQKPKEDRSLFVTAEILQISKQIELDRRMNASWAEMFRRPSHRKRCILTAALTWSVSTTGVLVINNYGPIIYRDLHFSPVKQLVYPAAWNTMTLGLNFFVPFVIDRFPRNKYAASGIGGAGLSLAVFTALVAEFVGTTNKSGLEAAVAFLFVFNVFIAMFLEGIQYAYFAEIWPNHLRAKGMSFAFANFSASCILWLQLAPTAFDTIEWRFYLIFVIISVVMGIVIWVTFPNTKGMPLEEVAQIFGDAEEVAVYQRELDGLGDFGVLDYHNAAVDVDSKPKDADMVEQISASDPEEPVKAENRLNHNSHKLELV